MKSAIFTSESNKTLELLLELAKKLGVTAKVVTEEELEDAGLVKAMKEGRTGKFVDTGKFLKGLK
jgi:hypothetical protein